MQYTPYGINTTEKKGVMDSRPGRLAGQQEPSPEELLAALAAQVDHQRVLDIGGELLDGSGLEDEVPEAAFQQEGESNG